MVALTWYAIIRLAMGVSSGFMVPADNQINARLMIETHTGEEASSRGHTGLT